MPLTASRPSKVSKVAATNGERAERRCVEEGRDLFGRVQIGLGATARAAAPQQPCRRHLGPRVDRAHVAGEAPCGAQPPVPVPPRGLRGERRPAHCQHGGDRRGTLGLQELDEAVEHLLFSGELGPERTTDRYVLIDLTARARSPGAPGPRASELAKGDGVDSCVDRGAPCAAVPEQLADLRQPRPASDELAGDGVTKPVRRDRRQACTSAGGGDEPVDGGRPDAVPWGDHGEEDRPLGTSRPASSEVARQRRADVCRRRDTLEAARLPRTSTSPRSQSKSGRSSATTSPARSPSRVSMLKMAR